MPHAFRTIDVELAPRHGRNLAAARAGQQQQAQEDTAEAQWIAGDNPQLPQLFVIELALAPSLYADARHPRSETRS